MKTTHTPGPWVIRALKSEGADMGFTDDLQIATVPDSDGFGVPVAMVSYNPKACREANAALIAAAPDMLAALESIESWIKCDWHLVENYGDKLSIVRAAIAKAKGG